MRGILAAGLVIAVMALAGCTDDPEPRFEEPTETPTASDSTSSTAAEPEPWEQKSKAGAVAFTRRWVDIFNEAQATGDTRQLAENSASDCKTCNGFIGQLDALYRDGGRFESSGWRVLVAAPGPDAVANEAQVNLRIARPRERVIDGNGDVDRFSGGNTTFSAQLTWEDGSWEMARLVRFA